MAFTSARFPSSPIRIEPIPFGPNLNLKKCCICKEYSPYTKELEQMAWELFDEEKNREMYVGFQALRNDQLVGMVVGKPFLLEGKQPTVEILLLCVKPSEPFANVAEILFQAVNEATKIRVADKIIQPSFLVTVTNGYNNPEEMKFYFTMAFRATTPPSAAARNQNVEMIRELRTIPRFF